MGYRLKIPEIDIEIIREGSQWTPELHLWFHITIIAFQTLKRGWGNVDMARSWINDRDNYFFEAVCDQLDITPDAMRGRILRALKRQDRRRHKWQDRVRERMENVDDV
jgi:hypothetical protein